MKSEIKFSIVIAAKNEEANLSMLFNALEKINYKTSLYEIIIVDDNSFDNTYETAKSFIGKQQNIRVLKALDKKYRAKKGALEFGISQTKNDYLLITDADCQPQPEWLNCFEEKFRDGYDLLIGIAPLNQEKGIINAVSCFENLRSSILNICLTKVGLPLTAAARNFGFKKSVYDKINGYKNISQKLSGDDDLFLMEAIKCKFKIGIVTKKNSFVFSSTKRNLGDYINQRARHTTASFNYLVSRKIFFIVWHSINLFMLFSPILFFINGNFLFLPIVKLLSDFVVVVFNQKKFNYRFAWLSIPFFQIIYEVMLVINFINAKLKKIEWK